jgi:hypothetical protein
MAANPNSESPELRIWREQTRALLATLKPREHAPTECYACGRDVNSHDVLNGGQMVRHLRMQEKHGFKNGGYLVHFTQAQQQATLAEFRARRANETQTPANTLETAPTVRSEGSSVERWRKFEDEMYVKHPRAAWLVLCARLEASEGKHAQAAGTVRLFRHELYLEREHEKALAEAYDDYRADVEMQNFAA